MFEGSTERIFPCPICAKGLEVRQSKKNKPYVVCDTCGIQVFVRMPAGIAKFEELVREAEKRNIWKRLAELENRYEIQCPVCEKKFCITKKLIQTSWFDGQLVGFRCPDKDCDGIAEWEEEQ